MEYDIDKANYADLKTLEDRVRRTLFAHGFNENTSTPLGDMNSLCRNLVQDAAATDAELAALRQRAEKAEALIEEIRRAMGGYPDSDLVSLATTLKVRDGVAEKAEARVEEALGLLRDHYDGAPDSLTRWVAAVIAVLQEGGKR